MGLECVESLWFHQAEQGPLELIGEAGYTFAAVAFDRGEIGLHRQWVSHGQLHPLGAQRR